MAAALNNKVYIGNLPFEFNVEELQALFGKYGKMEAFALKKGYAFIHFEQAQDAEVVVKELDQVEFGGRRLKVAYATSTGEEGRRARNDAAPTDGGASKNLFIANIPPHMKMREVEEFFEQFGKVENVKILPLARGNSAMSAFVDFSEVDAAQKAHDSELIMDGQRLRSDYNNRREVRPKRDDFEATASREYDGGQAPYRGSYEPRRSYSDRYHREEEYDGGYRRSHRDRSRSRSPPRGYDRGGRDYDRGRDSYDRRPYPRDDDRYARHPDDRDRGYYRERERRSPPRDDRDRKYLMPKMPKRHYDLPSARDGIISARDQRDRSPGPGPRADRRERSLSPPPLRSRSRD